MSSKVYEATIPVGSLKFRFTADSDDHSAVLGEKVGSILGYIESALEGYFYDLGDEYSCVEPEDGSFESKKVFFSRLDEALDEAQWGDIVSKRLYSARGKVGDLVKVCVPEGFSDSVGANTLTKRWWEPSDGPIRDFLRSEMSFSDEDIDEIERCWDTMRERRQRCPAFADLHNAEGLPFVVCEDATHIPDWCSSSVQGLQGVVLGENVFYGDGLPDDGQRMVDIHLNSDAENKLGGYRYKRCYLSDGQRFFGYSREWVDVNSIRLKPSHFRVVSKADKGGEV